MINVSIRPLQENDAYTSVKWRNDPEVFKYTGNTSSASIPLTLVTERRDELSSKSLNHIACGFGVGLSWGAVHFSTDRIIVPQLLEI